MKYFFTADEHYGHANIIKYCQRPFVTVEEMDEALIKNHNDIVSANDVVVHVGDFTLGNKTTAEEYISKLRGKHIFLQGSHDVWRNNLSYIFEKNINNYYVVACHYAMRTWPRSHYGSAQLYGHSHGKLEPYLRQWDVGVDNNDYKPVDFMDLVGKIKWE